MHDALIRLLSVALLLLMGVDSRGSVDVVIDTFTGGTVVEKSQGEPADDGSITVTITVTPASGYEIAKEDVMVAATLSPENHAGTRAPRLALMLELSGEDPDDLSQPRDYSFTVGAGLGAWVHTANFHRVGGLTIDAGTYRIRHTLNGVTWYLWPSVTTDADSHPYLTTFNGTSAPALDYPSKGVSYGAFGEQYSLWEVMPVDVDGNTYYQLYNVGMQAYAVWSANAGQKAVHLEASPADEHRTYFRIDGTASSCLITPIEAAEGTTLNSYHGDKPFLSSSGVANASTGYPNGEPDANGDGGLIQIYSGSPVWTLEAADNYVTIDFQQTSEEGDEDAAIFVPSADLAVPDGIKAYFVTGVDLQRGVVVIQQVDYLPSDTPLLLLADADATGFTMQAKPADIPLLSDAEKSQNRLRVGSPTIQPTAYEDYIFFRGEFVMVGGGTLSTGKVFLDLNSEQSAATRGVIGIGGSDGTTGITAVKRQAGTTASRWYSLDGRRLDGYPSRKGIYIRDGRKVVIK